MDFVVHGLGRWLHVAAGIVWVGFLVWFNVVSVPAMKAAMADGSAGALVRHVLPRTLAWFRGASLVTWLAGAALLGERFVDAFALRDPALVPIGLGAWLGTILLANVWGLLWPAQKIALGLVPADDAAKARARRRAFLVSRLNLALALPMLFFMSASGGVFRTAFF